MKHSRFVGIADTSVLIRATNDSRFRAFDSRTGELLWGNDAGSKWAQQPDNLHGERRAAVRTHGRRGGAFLGGGLNNSLVAFALSDIARKPLPDSVSKAVAGGVAARRGQPVVGVFRPASIAPGDTKGLVEKPAGQVDIRWR